MYLYLLYRHCNHDTWVWKDKTYENTNNRNKQVRRNLSCSMLSNFQWNDLNTFFNSEQVQCSLYPLHVSETICLCQFSFSDLIICTTASAAFNGPLKMKYNQAFFFHNKVKKPAETRWRVPRATLKLNHPYRTWPEQICDQLSNWPLTVTSPHSYLINSSPQFFLLQPLSWEQ